MSTEDIDERFSCLQKFVGAARQNLEDGPWDYLFGGAETETTQKRNRMAIDRYAFRPRVMRDVTGLDASTELLGRKLRLPVILAPIGSLQQLYSEGGAGVSQAAGEFGCVHMLSSVCDPGLEAVAKAAPDAARMFQLYVRGNAAWIDDHIRRAVDNGYMAFSFTIDLDHYSRRERDISRGFKSKSRSTQAVGEEFQAMFNWDDFKRIRDKWDIPLALKGIATAEDTAIAVEHGCDIVYVSNHGGRQLDHGRGGMDVLAECVAAADGKAKVVLDGGIMRGTDIVKAKILGADAVGIGRLQGFAYAAAGRPGVVRMLELLEIEVRTCLALLGVINYAGLEAAHLYREDSVVKMPHPISAFPLLDEGYN
ncbi:MAG: alpha-hydroxy acid oxidase [Proteobacteria bacterium]|nr:alpha-hydroxy acid oxidase [Pseudomonadota bacterium]